MTPFWDTYVVPLGKLEHRMVAFRFYIGSTYSTYAVFSPQQKTNIKKFGSFVCLYVKKITKFSYHKKV